MRRKRVTESESHLRALRSVEAGRIRCARNAAEVIESAKQYERQVCHYWCALRTAIDKSTEAFLRSAFEGAPARLTPKKRPKFRAK
jgi:hypothetical protein